MSVKLAARAGKARAASRAAQGTIVRSDCRASRHHARIVTEASTLFLPGIRKLSSVQGNFDAMFATP